MSQTLNNDGAAQQMSPGVDSMQNPEQNDGGAGLYAVPFYPLMGAMAGSSPTVLIPIKYKIPTRSNSAAETGGEVVAGPEARQQQRQEVVVRRFQFAIHLDLALILKLAAAVFLFNQEGSRQRLILFVFFATLVYLYQTGVLSPFVRWIQRGAPPRPRPVAVRQENDPHVHLPPEENAGVARQEENRPAGAGNENLPERGNGMNLWGIAKEIQTLVVGFVVSLIPGFHHHND